MVVLLCYNESVSVLFVCHKANNYWNQLSILRTGWNLIACIDKLAGCLVRHVQSRWIFTNEQLCGPTAPGECGSKCCLGEFSRYLLIFWCNIFAAFTPVNKLKLNNDDTFAAALTQINGRWSAELPGWFFNTQWPWWVSKWRVISCQVGLKCSDSWQFLEPVVRP